MEDLRELQHIDISRPDDAPPNYGYSIYVRASGLPDQFVAAFRLVWRAAAQWGRWDDSTLGDWPDDDAFLLSLPAGFRLELQTKWGENIADWIRAIHDRDWVLWSVALCGPVIKIDLDSVSMPISSFGVRLAAEVLGAQVVDYGDWKPCHRNDSEEPLDPARE